MKKLKKILLISSSASLFSSLLIAAKCNNDSSKNESNDDKKIGLLSDAEFENLINNTNNLNDIAQLTFNSGFGPGKSLNKTLPTEIEENPGNLKISINDKYSDSINVILNNAKTERDRSRNVSNIKGEVTVFVTFINKASNKEIFKSIKLTGLASNPVGADHRGGISGDPNAAIGGQKGLLEYHKLSQEQRFSKDNDSYINQLKNMLSHGGIKEVDILKSRGLNINEQQIKEFDEKARSVKFDSYLNSALKGFTVPTYENGQVKLNVLDDAEINKGPSPIDTVNRNPVRSNGLARTVLNETYKMIAEQTYQVSFTGLNNFEKERAELTNLKNQITNWTKEQRDAFTFKDRAALKADYEFKLYNLELEKKQLGPNGLHGLEKSFEDRKNQIENEYKSEDSRLANISNDDLKKEIDKKIAEYSVSKYTTESGTMWIMDFMVPEQGKGATKFYFGTNSHVARAIKNHTSKFSMTRLNENVGVGSTLRLSNLDDKFTKFLFDSVPSGAVNVIFEATDFLVSKPSDFLESKQKEQFKDVEEFMDFAVIEIDFEKVLQNGKNNLGIVSNNKFLSDSFKDRSVEDIVKSITNNYQYKTEKHIKFKADSYLKNYEQIDRPIVVNNKNSDEVSKFNNLESLYILGYPSSTGDYFLENYIDEDQQKEVRNNFSMWINADDKYYKNVIVQEGAPANHSKENLERGDFLSYQIGYRSFIDKPGLTDGFLAASRTGNDLYSVNGKKYFNYGLHLMPRSYTPTGGASGSSVRNKKNELIAVFHTSNSSAKTGLAAVFRSYGYDYKGLFGNYKLPAYDLIYGGATGQKNSYREELEKKYKNNGNQYKTNLFPNGFGKEQIPPQFKFTETSAPAK